MHKFPALPDTLITRQLECISCKELFVVSEDIIESGEAPTAEWQASSDAASTTNLRFHPTRNQRQIMPEGRSAPQQIPARSGSYTHLYHVNCPRCSTDNRNWMHIIHHPPQQSWAEQLSSINKFVVIISFALIVTTFLIVVAGILPATFTSDEFSLDTPIILSVFIFSLVAMTILILQNQLFHHIETVTAVTGGVLLFLFFALAMFLATYLQDTEKLFTRAIPLAVSIFVVALVTAMSTTDQWRAQLHQWRLNRWLHKKMKRSLLPRASMSGIGITLIIAVAVPFLIYFVLPTFIAILSNSSTEASFPEKPADIIEASQAVIEGWRDEQDQITGDEKTALDAVLASLNTFLDTADEDDLLLAAADTTMATLEKQVNKVPEMLKSDIEIIVHTLEMFVERGETAVEREESGVPEKFPWKFFYLWMVLGIVSGSIMAAIATTAVNNHVRKVNRHLPRPIFSSVANMTRVVLWEANRALEIGGLIHHIEWTIVQRNDSGGIDLHGIYRAPSDDEDSSRVRAKIYEIRSNKWGRIEKAFISDRLVPVSPPDPVEENVETVTSAGRVRV